MHGTVLLASITGIFESDFHSKISSLSFDPLAVSSFVLVSGHRKIFFLINNKLLIIKIFDQSSNNDVRKFLILKYRKILNLLSEKAFAVNRSYELNYK